MDHRDERPIRQGSCDRAVVSVPGGRQEVGHDRLARPARDAARGRARPHGRSRIRAPRRGPPSGLHRGCRHRAVGRATSAAAHRSAPPRRRRRWPPSASRSSGRLAGASRRRTRRASGDRAAIRARTMSWNDDVSDDGRQLATCREELLRDQGSASGSFRDDDQHARRGARALDRLDQAAPARHGRAAPATSVWLAGSAGEPVEIVRPGMVAVDRVGLVRADDGEALRPGESREERHEGPGGCVGSVQVLDDEQRPGVARRAGRAHRGCPRAAAAADARAPR